jgi:hypothetical protein
VTRSSSIGSFAAALCATILIASSIPGRDGQPAHPIAGFLFQTSDRCLACHNGLTTPSGADVSIGYDWRPSMMANSGRDPYFYAGVRHEIADHPESQVAIEDECSACHMPMARYAAKVTGSEGAIFAHSPFDKGGESDRLAADSVSCSLCHQITPDKLGTRESFNAGFVVDTKKPRGERDEFGPYQIDAGHSQIMRSSSGGFQPVESAHIRQAALCGTCHTLYTRALGPQGKVIGELPEQMPYQEWLHSSYSEAMSCQSCHMPAVSEPMPITALYGEPRADFSRHVFVGGNFFMIRLLNRHRADLGVEALPQELNAAAARTVNHLENLAAVVSVGAAEQRGDRFEFTVTVQNQGGHKLPTAYPSRRAWLHVTVWDRSDATVFESGALEPSGLIKGNDNDADAGRFELHYQTITDPGQVQIYEAIMADAAGAVTTGLLNAVRYVKDNRLLPLGFAMRRRMPILAADGIPSDIRLRWTAAQPRSVSRRSCCISRSAIAGRKICARMAQSKMSAF